MARVTSSLSPVLRSYILYSTSSIFPADLTVDSFTLKSDKAASSVPNAATGSMTKLFTPPFVMLYMSPRMDAFSRAGSSRSTPFHASTHISTGSVTPEISYSTFTSVDHGHCCRTITRSMESSSAPDAKNDSATANRNILFIFLLLYS